MTRSIEQAATNTLNSVLRPSRALLQAALSGLLGLSAGCDDQSTPVEEEDPDEHEHDAEPTEQECAPASGKGGSGGASGAGTAGHTGGATEESEEPEKELSTVDVQHTHSELTAMCDQRQGYVAIHGSCSGVNACQGFFYGDWDEDAQLVEHTCAGVNGCAGLSCLIPSSKDAKRELTGEEIMKLDDDWYLERAGQYGPKACRTCHVESKYNEELEDYDYDYTKLKIPVWPNPVRDASNWLERPALYQENLIAFGARGITPEGLVYSNMASYAKLFSKREIENVVQYMRKFDPNSITFKQIKLKPGKAE